MSDWHRVLITGGRDWPAAVEVFTALSAQLDEHERITVIHGDCPTGADAHAKQWAQRNIIWQMAEPAARIRHEQYPAPWSVFDKSAGPMRNRYMVGLEADICIAFPTAKSRGTISCMDLAAAAGIPVVNLGVQR